VLSQPEHACLLIADISGYTSYLAGSELDHAQDILADLMTTVVGALRPGFRLAKLEGDAAFAYQLADRVDGSQLLDTVERTYFAFRRRLRDIAQATACECNACTLMPRLDLKFIAHHGVIIRHRIAGREELVGSDVIVAHRLLKNHVVERLGTPAYALFSAACVAAMGIDPGELGMTEYRDSYDDLGEVAGWVHDLGAAWAAELDRRQVVVTERDAGYTYEAVHQAPRDLVWSFMTDPTLRPLWQFGVTSVDQLPTTPRRGVGTTNHCMHGADVLIEEILDWRPTDQVTQRTTMPNGFKAVSMYAFEEVPDGTRVRILFTWGKNRREREEQSAVRDLLAGMIVPGQAKLHAVLADEMTRRDTIAAEGPPEPVPPQSDGRELSRPVIRAVPS
jgi:Protein of unknown function (DUF2652)/Polyketide cyclase / dehydrase and lipid transport